MFKMFPGWRKLQRSWRRLAVVAVLVNGLLLLRRHIVVSMQPATRPRVLGYYCREFKSCGGWADRQKGIVNAYVIATILELEFKIFMPVPCDLTFFLTPRDQDWRITLWELKGSSVSWLKIFGGSTDFAKSFADSEDPLQLFPATHYVFLSTNMELVQHLRHSRLAARFSWLVERSIPEIYHEVLGRLFAPMPGPRLVLDVFRDLVPPTAKIVCAQIRMGGSWDTEFFNTMDQFKGLAHFLVRYNHSDTHRIMFTSDTPTVLQVAKQHFPSVTVEIKGPVTHVDRSKGVYACGGFGHAITEQLALSTCDVLVISESGMGKIAAFMRNTDRDLYLFHDGIVEDFSRNQSFPNRVSW